MLTQFKKHDIYCNVHPFKETAILLGQDSDTPDLRYINASRIKSVYDEPAEDNLMIAAQGPIMYTTRNFWKLIHQERVGMVLQNTTPGDCAKYYPEVVGETECYGDMCVELLKAEQRSVFVTQRQFRVLEVSIEQVTNTKRE